LKHVSCAVSLVVWPSVRTSTLHCLGRRVWSYINRQANFHLHWAIMWLPFSVVDVKGVLNPRP
jgi:hypothetical protein